MVFIIEVRMALSSLSLLLVAVVVVPLDDCGVTLTVVAAFFNEEISDLSSAIKSCAAANAFSCSSTYSGWKPRYIL